MNRRDFLKGMIGVGGIVATSALPAWGEEKADLFSTRGNFERLVLSYQHVNIGLKEPFSVLHISDTHLTSAYPDEHEFKQKLCVARTKTFGGRQEEALRDSIAWAKGNSDYIVHTGDLIDWQSRANFDLVKMYFGEGMCGSLGNHEYSRSMWFEKEERTEEHKALTKNLIASVYPFDLSLQSTVVKGVNFVTLDDVYGYVTAKQVERFNDEVKKGLPIVLCMHIPFISDRLWMMHDKYWNFNRKFTSADVPAARMDYKIQKEDSVTREFIETLKKEPLVKAILCGHFHISIADRFSPTAMQYVVGGNFMFHGEEILFT